MVDFKVDITVKERRNNFWVPVDKLVAGSPDSAIAMLNSKYGSSSKVFRSNLKKVLVKNVDSWISSYDSFFNLKR